ncbi:polygalacturonase inhibitor-like [Lolium perenne]|uniref:polygalacturonase inhibitor-like n=1 Tax=Lolium perenne TaxID=4522 RepID=UPI0021F669FC|nr:polygalacturonase inhibitor-like [Lolium perenne]
MRMHSQALLVVLLSSLLAGAANAEAPREPTNKDCHPRDRAAMLAIMAALGQSGTPYPENYCCDWFGVTCDKLTGRVVGLSLFQQPQLTGTIPDAMANLIHLQDLFLHHIPALSGPIPPAIGKLSNLTSLHIAWTAVSGPVPSFLAALTKLSQLDLSFNSLTGAIPASLGSIPNLSGINLSRNRLTGAIPSTIFSKSAGNVYLYLSHNNLTGPLPAEFADMSFVQLDLSRNALMGDASRLFGRGKALQYLDLSRNAFDFDMSGVVFPEQLDFVDVSHNAISGSIPAQVANLTNLQFFNVSYNRLCGALPTGGKMPTFDLYNFQHNKCLCGAPFFPSCKT